MLILGLLLVTLVLLWCLAYFRVPLLVWTLCIVVLLAAATYLLYPAWLVASLLWLGFLPIAILLNVRRLRRHFISNHILKFFKGIMPTMSTTEREALEAGSVWWDGDLFSGKPRWKKWLDLPAPKLSAEEQAFVDGPVEQLCRMIDDWRINHERHDLSEETWRFIKEQGFFGMIIPKQFGGLEFSALAHSTVVMKISSRSITAAVTIMVPNSLGPAELLLHYGTEEQKQHYLPRLARGEEVPCFALTGPEAGSDAGAMTDTGVVCRGEFDGKQDVLGLRLNWQKRYITLGPVATVLGLAFKLYDPDHLLSDKEERGITVALIPTDTPGITIGRRHNPLNIAFQNGPNSGKDVFIPMDWIIGGVDRVGQGWRMLMESLAAGRAISLPALSTGAGKLCSRATGAYSRIRTQFKMPIGRFEGVQEALARIAGYTYMMDAARTITAAAVDMGQKPSVISAIIKYQHTEHMRRVVNDAMDVQGGSAICMGPSNYLAWAYQALPISITVEGANILTRSLIIFGQGAIRCHPYVLKEMQAVAARDAKKASRVFDRAFFGHIGFVISNFSRSLFMGLTGARLVMVPADKSVRRYYQHLTRMSAAFALMADMAMLTMGGDLKRKEKISARFADILSNLYLGSTVLKHYANQGYQRDDLPLVQWNCDDILFRMQQAFHGLFCNFPNRPLAWCLRRVMFPFGMRYRPPSDDLGGQVAEILLSPSETRDRLTSMMFLPTDESESLARLEQTLVIMVEAEPVERKLRRWIREHAQHDIDPETRLQEGIASKIITEQEAELLRQAHRQQWQVIQVDDFSPDSF